MVEQTANASESAPVVVAVPARLASSRLPGKVMADIGGRPMLQHVLERCSRARGVAAVFACTDSPDVVRACDHWGFNALLTPESCSSGSERLAAVAAELVAAGGAAPQDTLVINVQGDQPLLDPAIIEAMAAEFGRRRRPPVLTPVYRLAGETIHDPNVVKVLRAGDGRAITFSRTALPHVRDLPPEQWHRRTPYWGHVGLYGYRGDVLAGWGQLPHSPLEELEKLEQLRLIEAGIPIATFSVSADCLSVDTAEQLEQVRRLVETL
ncbi:3-deoxy-manno-octulosonate cytidylyltransferase [Cyanobium sp. ATX 6A2]|uniref:3-deoxy-manno-octulosonate cytidylyltransferase n=1 Tax=Cyanobium sp. ATX 6A2 TaxID=2823700 RepID=UPI0020CCBA2A|nr:3-deoxy-manno-octulosonate cytidylyltransferase [Cyanobium sp. ATX 6A2]MCP9888099.1 3-deoxy-manno-octulosonate cytidylyltransferase [Cyanobium sp. ATX 6A2]